MLGLGLGVTAQAMRRRARTFSLSNLPGLKMLADLSAPGALFEGDAGADVAEPGKFVGRVDPITGPSLVQPDLHARSRYVVEDGGHWLEPDGLDDEMSAPISDVQFPIFAAAVIDMGADRSLSGPVFSFFESGSAYRFLQVAGSSLQGYSRYGSTSNVALSLDHVAGGKAVVSMQLDGTNMTISANGQSITVPANQAVGNPTQFRLGRYRDSSPYSSLRIGDLVWAQTDDQAQIDQAIAALADKYGIQF